MYDPISLICLVSFFFFISSAVDSAYVGHCFTTAHCAMMHFLVPFVTGFRWCGPEVHHISSFAHDLEGGTGIVCAGVRRCL